MAYNYCEERNNFFSSMFFDPAIEDYLMARYAWFEGYSRQFYWSAGQTFEKLTKCALIMNGDSAQFGHDWYKKFAENRSSVDCTFRFVPRKVSAEAVLHKVLSRSGFPTVVNVDEILERICTQGSPVVRYDQLPAIDLEPMDLFCLDELFKWFVCVSQIHASSDEISDAKGLAVHLLPRKILEKKGFKRGNFAFNPEAFSEGVLVASLKNSSLSDTIICAKLKLFEHEFKDLLSRLRDEVTKKTLMKESEFDLLCNYWQVR